MTLLNLDHLAVSGENRDAARAHIEDALGVAMQGGGVHEKFGTHNHLLGLENGLYLEAISINPDAAQPGRPRWFDLDNFSGSPRLSNWICAVDDLDAAIEKWPASGDAVALERGDLRWSMAVPATGKLPFDGLFPPLIQWHGELHPVQMLKPSGIAMKMLTITHPNAENLARTLGAITPDILRFETGPQSGLVAEFETPHGRRVLT